MSGNLMRQIAGKPKETAAPAAVDKGSGAPGDIVDSAARGELPFPDFYDANYAPLLAYRAQGFGIILENLERRCLAGGPPALIDLKLPDGSYAGKGYLAMQW